MLRRLIYGSFVLPLFFVAAYFIWGVPQHLLISVLIGVALGLSGGVWWLRFLKENLKEGVFNTNAYSTSLRVVFMAGGLVLCYLAMAPAYAATTIWAMLVALVSNQICSAVGVALLQKRTAQTIRCVYSKRGLLWMVLYVISVMILGEFLAHTGRSSVARKLETKSRLWSRYVHEQTLPNLPANTINPKEN